LTSPRSIPTSPCELSEREGTSPSNLKVVGALDNYSLVFVIFINFFGQLKDWVGQVLFSVSCPKGQFEKYVNVEACSPVEGEDPFIPFDNLYRQAYFVMHTFLVLSALWWPYLLHYFTHILFSCWSPNTWEIRRHPSHIFASLKPAPRFLSSSWYNILRIVKTSLYCVVL
jgi:hypothetical protein